MLLVMLISLQDHVKDKREGFSEILHLVRLSRSSE